MHAAEICDLLEIQKRTWVISADVLPVGIFVTCQNGVKKSWSHGYRIFKFL